jgi:hypothetical protein
MSWRKLVSLAALAATLLAVVILFPAHRSPPPPPLPNPNGYDDFVAAGNSVASSWDFGSLSPAELAALVSKNQPALNRLRQGLQHQSRAPQLAAGQLRMGEATNFKKLASALAAEAQWALQESRTNDAAEIYLEGVRFGHACLRGGVAIDSLIGTASESIALGGLEKVIDSLPAAACRRIIAEMLRLEENEETAAEVLDQEREWIRRSASVKDRLAGIIQTRSFDPVKNVRSTVEGRLAEMKVKRHKLIIHCAGRAFALEEGRPARGPSELVPRYLKSIPAEPAL